MAKYWIRVKPSAFPGEKYSVSFCKKYGNCYGGSAGARDKEELLRLLRGIVEGWEGYDGMLGRNGVKVTPRNLELEVLAPDVAPDEIIDLIRKKR